jgi:hypothetical protein
LFCFISLAMKRRRSGTDTPRQLGHLSSAQLRTFYTVVNGKHRCTVCAKEYNIQGDPDTGTSTSIRKHLENKHALAALAQVPRPARPAANANQAPAQQQVRHLSFPFFFFLYIF